MRPQLDRLAQRLDHPLGVFEPLGVRELVCVAHMTRNSPHRKGPILRHQRVDEQLVSAGPVGCMIVTDFTT
jgi:hypothetical protein